MSENRPEMVIRGTPISPGLTQGLIHVHRGLLGPIDAPVDIKQNNVNEEFSRLDDATARISDDVSVVKECLAKLCSELRISSPPGLGAMVETPAAALAAQEIVKHVYLMSFGTNDLTQYVFAADRENAAVERY